MRKKNVAALLCALAVSITACGSESADQTVQESGNDIVVTEEQETEVVESTEEMVTEEAEANVEATFMEDEQKMLDYIEQTLNSDKAGADVSKYQAYIDGVVAFVDGLDKTLYYDSPNNNIQFRDFERTPIYEGVFMRSVGNSKWTIEETIANNNFIVVAYGDFVEDVIPVQDINGYENSRDILCDYDEFCRFLDYLGKPDRAITYVDNREWYSRQTMLAYDLGEYGITFCIQSGYSEMHYDGQPWRYISKVALYDKDVFQFNILESLDRVVEAGHDTISETKLMESDYWSIDY